MDLRIERGRPVMICQLGSAKNSADEVAADEILFTTVANRCRLLWTSKFRIEEFRSLGLPQKRLS